MQSHTRVRRRGGCLCTNFTRSPPHQHLESLRNDLKRLLPEYLEPIFAKETFERGGEVALFYESTTFFSSRSKTMICAVRIALFEKKNQPATFGRALLRLDAERIVGWMIE